MKSSTQTRHLLAALALILTAAIATAGCGGDSKPAVDVRPDAAPAADRPFAPDARADALRPDQPGPPDRVVEPDGPRPDAPRPDLPRPDGPPPDAGPFISGSKIVHHITESGVTDVPEDLSARTIVALVVDAAGGFTPYPGKGKADGTFVVPGVPLGATYYLQVGRDNPRFFVSSARFIDLGHWTVGRPDVARPDQSSYLVFNATGMDPWQVWDILELTSVGAGYSTFDVSSAADENPPTTGQTALAATKLMWPRLLDSSKGDTAHMLQLSTQHTASDFYYQAATKVWQLPAVTMENGKSTLADGQFTAVNRDASLSLSWKRSKFESYRQQVNPNAKTSTMWVGVGALPGESSHPPYWDPVELLWAATSKTTDVDTGTMQYGMALPRNWRTFLDVIYLASMEYTMPGVTEPLHLDMGRIGFNDSIDAYDGKPVEPQLSPPSEPKLGGKNAFDDLEGVGESPTLSWGPPQLGTADGYVIFVYKLLNNGGQLWFAAVCRITTKSTGVVIPPGVLQAGEYYFASISAKKIGGGNIETEPFAIGFPSAEAMALTGRFSR